MSGPHHTEPAGGLRLAPLAPLAFVRHGATEPNLAHLRCGGDLDVPLTDTGREQALLAAQRVQAQALRIGLIVSSGLQRTDETARIIARRLGGVPVITERGFNERLLGDWNLCPQAETEPWLRMGMHPPGGEPAEVFSARIEAALERLLPRLAEGVLLVSSRGVGRVLGELTGRPGPMVLANGEVARFDVTSFARFRNFGVDGQGGSGFGRDALDSELVGADADINNTCGSDA